MGGIQNPISRNGGKTVIMKQRFFIFIILFGMIALLIGLNAASYAPAEKSPDVESLPHRSTLNSGATGLQAFYTLLVETGHRVIRWQTPPAALLTAGDQKPGVYVVAGTLRKEFTRGESADLLRWVSDGGVLVLIDREPPAELLATTTNWQLKAVNPLDPRILDADPADPATMAGGIAAVRPVQPSILTRNINAIQPSAFAGSVEISRFGVDSYVEEGPSNAASGNTVDVATPSDSSPVVHISDGNKQLLVDAPFGDGKIVVLSDPFVVANGGIALADNAILAINLVEAGQGIIAFDEYHQGYGTDNNRFLQFFAGTPVVAIFFQAMLLVGLAFLSNSRRFARPVPEPEPDRLSKLEYVAAMAELQNRTKAYDLAIENIYGEFRRRAARLLGVDNKTIPTNQLASQIADRVGSDQFEIGATLVKCEEIIRGEPTNKSEAMALTAKIREIESKLGLSRTGRSRVG
jgi:hypothetical protein